ncbi:MAG: dTDP-4-dehydrorhamnose 3,5-epimerase family protein [Chloroflexi bacterium]|nr:dTDP-4-dehydrorhamnose 3,5-epimerase family protein [Chloroflexota bacterium]
MSLRYTDSGNPSELVRGVVVRRLRVNRDLRGTLVETLRVDWPDVYDPAGRPFAQCYCSYTEHGIARDEARWHVHEHQEDRFVVVAGELVLALFDRRPASPTHGRLNLIRMGESGGDDGQLLVVIPHRVLHGFLSVGRMGVLLLNYPTRLYDPADEGRIPFDEVDARLPNGRPFQWDAIRADLDVKSPALRH